MDSAFTLSIDWLACTVLASNPQETMKVLGGDWSRAKGGFRGYPLSWIRSDGVQGVNKFGTNAPRRPNEIHVDLSGGLVSALTLDQIRALLKWVHAQQGHATLIDCALDDRAGTVPMATIRRRVLRHAGCASAADFLEPHAWHRRDNWRDHVFRQSSESDALAHL